MNNVGNINDVSAQMKSLMSGKQYNLANHNCHVAQEVTRYRYGWAALADLDYANIVQYMIV